MAKCLERASIPLMSKADALKHIEGDSLGVCRGLVAEDELCYWVDVAGTSRKGVPSTLKQSSI
jgi:hypothetical protein